MADYGLKISKSGQDVKTCTDDQLIFSSKFNNWKVSASGTTTLTLTGTAQNSVSIAHGLGYVPVVLVYVIDGAVARKIPTALADGTTGFDPFIDATYLKIWGAGTAGTYTLKYFIFLEKIE